MHVTGLRHGVVLLPETRWERTRWLWRHVEELGFDHAWTYDHLMWRALRTEPWFAAVPTLTAAATATSHIRLGTLVASPSFRHPVTFAKELMTLDDISGGRLICGVGAGGGGYDDEVTGGRPWSPGRRADRFAEFVELTDLLLRQAETSYRGKHFTAHDAYLAPGCVQQPRVPFAVAATGPRGMRLAARHADIWVTAGRPGWGVPMRYDEAVPLLTAQVAAFEDACVAGGRDPSSVARMVVAGAMIEGATDSHESYVDFCGLARETGFTDVVTHWPRPRPPYRGDVATFEAIAADVLSRGGHP